MKIIKFLIDMFFAVVILILGNTNGWGLWEVMSIYLLIKIVINQELLAPRSRNIN